MRAAFCPILAVLLATTGAGALHAENLLLPGEYPAGQVAGLPTAGWHAVVATEDGDIIRAVELVEDALPDDPSRVRVGVGDATGDVRFFVRDARIAAGPVVTVVEAPRQVPQDLPLLMFLGSAMPHRVDLDCVEAGDDRAECVLVYLHDGRRQTLARFAAHQDEAGAYTLDDDAAPSVLWTGDLDRDGALDLLLDLGTGYAESTPTLLLSSARTGDELAGVVARDTRVLALR
jgi:hypothetical protein